MKNDLIKRLENGVVWDIDTGFEGADALFREAANALIISTRKPSEALVCPNGKSLYVSNGLSEHGDCRNCNRGYNYHTDKPT